MEKVKVQKIEGNGVYESFQRYSHDPYLGKKMETYTAAHDTMPGKLGQTIKESLLVKFRHFDKMFREDIQGENDPQG